MEDENPIMPVVFRVDRNEDGTSEVVAVFPTEPWNANGTLITVYAHAGQHSGADGGWYHSTRRAKPEEYASLKTELESAPYHYRLQVYQRMTRGHRNAFSRNLRDRK